MSSKLASVLLALSLALVPTVAFAQAPSDRVAFGNHVHVGATEIAQDACAFGGNTVVEGEVLGDAVAFGGDVVLRGAAVVHGDVTAFGGQVRDERAPLTEVPSEASDHATASAPEAERGPIDTVWEWVQETARSAVAHVLLFLLGLLLIGLSRDRLGAMQVTMVRDGVKTAAMGFVGYVAAVVGIVLLVITIIGIPVAVVAGLLLPVASYIGLAAAATVIGAALPLPQLKGNEVAQLAAGVGVLFVCSIVPVVGKIATVVIACLGFGALVRTRFRPVPPSDVPAPDGPMGPPAPAAS